MSCTKKFPIFIWSMVGESLLREMPIGLLRAKAPDSSLVHHLQVLKLDRNIRGNGSYASKLTKRSLADPNGFDSIYTHKNMAMSHSPMAVINNAFWSTPAWAPIIQILPAISLYCFSSLVCVCGFAVCLYVLAAQVVVALHLLAFVSSVCFVSNSHFGWYRRGSFLSLPYSFECVCLLYSC